MPHACWLAWLPAFENLLLLINCMVESFGGMLLYMTMFWERQIVDHCVH